MKVTYFKFGIFVCNGFEAPAVNDVFVCIIGIKLLWRSHKNTNWYLIF